MKNPRLEPYEGTMSLITPGGIATAMMHDLAALVLVAHHPWRDRNTSTPRRGPTSPPGRSSPLEGSQRGGMDEDAPLASWSLITPGGIATR